MMIYAVTPFVGRRLRARRVNELSFIEQIAAQAKKEDQWVADIEHGGDVAKSYSFPASTECVLAISDPFGIVVYWTARVRANGVTNRGAAEACLEGSGILFDKRTKSSECKELALAWLKEAHRQVVPDMVVLAVASI